MKNHTEFIEEVLIHVPGATKELALLAIKNSIIEFCEKSLIIQADLDPIDVTALQSDYDFDPPTGYKVVKIMGAWYKQRKLDPIAPDEIDSPVVYNPDSIGAPTEGNEPATIFQKDDQTFTLYPPPPERLRGAVTMRVALKPKRSSSQIEDVIYEDYFEAICLGARYRLMMTPAKPFTNLETATASRLMFEQEINKARQRANRGYVRSALRVQMRTI